MRTFVAKTTVNFPDFELYVRIGDMLVFDPSNANNLTVYRGGSIVKTIKATPISIAAMLKVKMLEEIVHKIAPPAPKPAPIAPKKPAEASKPPKAVKAEVKKETFKKEEMITLRVEDQKPELLASSREDVVTVPFEIDWKESEDSK
jgi:ribosomal protein L12E/L44/L45/RPP1/RPP2